MTDNTDTPRTPRALPTRDEIAEIREGVERLRDERLPWHAPVATEAVNMLNRAIDAALALIDKENTMPEPERVAQASARDLQRYFGRQQMIDIISGAIHEWFQMEPPKIDFKQVYESEEDSLIHHVLSAVKKGSAMNDTTMTLHERGVIERRRQVTDEGYTPERDHGRATELLRAAACYVEAAEWLAAHGSLGAYGRSAPYTWPWGASYWKPSSVTRMQEKAYALTLAAQEAMTRACPTTRSPCPER